jgi:hypothetical protein
MWPEIWAFAGCFIFTAKFKSVEEVKLVLIFNYAAGFLPGGTGMLQSDQ